MPYSFSFKYLNTSITFKSDKSEIIDYVAFIFRHLGVNSSPGLERVYIIDKADEGYSLTHRGKTLFNNFPIDTAIENIDNSVETMVMSENPEVTFFHAGSISDMKGNVTLLLSGTGGGKTTLCTMLTQRNYYLEGDELLGISGEKPLIPIPFKKALKLRRESLPFLNDKGNLLMIPAQKRGEERLIYWLPDEKGQCLPEDVKRIRMLFFLRFSLHGPNKVSTLSPSDAIKRLIDECHDFSEKRLMAMDIILSIINQTEAFEIIYNWPDFAISYLNAT